MRSRRRAAPLLVPAVVTVVVLLLAGLSGCASAVAGQAVAAATVSAGTDPGFIRGTDGGEDDQLAAAVLTDLQGFWGATFPTVSGGRPLTPLAGYFSVDSSRPGPPPPCLRSTDEIEGNAYYCPTADVLGYDRAALVPVLRQEFGDTAAVVVLAHEFGHALQQRLGVRSGASRGGSSIPTILSEAQADCYGGLFLRQVREGRTPNLRADADGVDSAMAALVTFRDPVGTGAGDANAHGNAFDRVSSFQTGFDGDPATCAGLSVANRRFTQTEFRSLSDAAGQGNLALPALLGSMGPDLDRFFREQVTARGGRWATPATTAACPGDTAQGAVAFCAGPGTVAVDPAALGRQHAAIGDYASGTLLASRYGLAALAALGRPVEGPDAGRDALCLAGAYTGSIAGSGTAFGLSPGDLDEAVQVMLRSPAGATDAGGTVGAGSGYERVRVFRTGVDGGAAACLDR